MQSIVVIHPTLGPVASSVRVATRFREKLVGLMGVPTLPPGEGMLFAHTNAVHGCFMREPLWLIYLTQAQVVVRIATLRPWRSGPIIPQAHWVLELSIRTSLDGMQVGDVLKWTEST